MFVCCDDCVKLNLMILYMMIIIISMIVVTIFNWLVLGWTFVNALFWVTSTTGIQIIITVLLAMLTGWCVPRKFYRESKIYAVSKREVNFYRAIKINVWKDHICELGALGGFSKKKVQSPNDPAYIDRFIVELNKGMFMHTVGTLGSFLILLVPVPGFWSIAFPVALVDAILNLLPLMVLRYNKPRLLMLKTRLMRSQKSNTADSENAATVNEASTKQDETPKE